MPRRRRIEFLLAALLVCIWGVWSWSHLSSAVVTAAQAQPRPGTPKARKLMACKQLAKERGFTFGAHNSQQRRHQTQAIRAGLHVGHTKVMGTG